MKIHSTKLMGFHDVFMDNSWSHYKGFYCSLSEAQRGAEDRGQIKALVGGMPVTVEKGCILWFKMGQSGIFGFPT